MSEHIVPKRTYYVIYVVLLFCTYLTWQVAVFDMGRANTVVALGIAAFKATLVVLFFMHLKYSSRLTKITVAAGFFTFFVLITMALTDYISRAWGMW